MKKIVTVVGNRPQFVKAAIVFRQWRDAGLDQSIQNILVNTGQHYDPLLSDVFFIELGLPPAPYDLGIGSGPVVDQIGAMLPKLRQIFEAERPDGVLVFGDTNSTIGAALAAAHMHIPLVHVEAGERNFRRMNAPEEINRIVTDELAWLCLTSTEKARHYLLREGFNTDRAVWVGDPMYDLFVWASEQIKNLNTLRAEDIALEEGKFVLATIHRAENTSNRDRLLDLLGALDSSQNPVLLPVHPRVKQILKSWDWAPTQSLRLIEPLGYFDLLSILSQCRMCVTDSGGLAREAFFAGKPSIVPMANSGWNEIVESGWIKVVPGPGEDVLEQMTSFTPTSRRPEGLFGDGKASERIGREILQFLDNAPVEGAWHPLGDFFSIPQPEDRSQFTFDGLEHLLRENAHPRLRVGYFVGGNLNAVGHLCQVQREVGILTTFIFAADTDLYNLLSESVVSVLQLLSTQGHSIAVSSGGGMSLSQLKSFAEAMESVFGIRITSCYDQGALHSVESSEVTQAICPSDRDFLRLISSCVTDKIILGRSDWWNAVPVSTFETEQRSAFARLEAARKWFSAGDD